MNDIKGTIWRFGNHVSTDVIHAPEYFSLDPERVSQGLFHKLDPTLQPRIRTGDFFIAGCNFGCGSSRETSIRSLLLNKVGAIVAVDFARIFFRNAQNNGLPCLTFRHPEDLQRLQTGMSATLSFADNCFLTQEGEIILFDPVPRFIRDIWEAGGLLEYAQIGTYL